MDRKMTEQVDQADILKVAEEVGVELNMKQIRFCREYLVDRNATQAYIRAGYSEDGASQNSSRLMGNDDIAALISRFEADRAIRTQTDADQVISQLARLGFSDIRKIFSPTGEMLRVEELDDDTAAAIQSIKVTKRLSGELDSEDRPMYEDVVEYRLADKRGALELIGKNHKLFTDKVEHAGGVDIRATTRDMTDAEAAEHVADMIKAFRG